MGRSLRNFAAYSRPFAIKNARSSTTGCPFSKRQQSQVAPTAELNEEIFANAKPYSEVPGPKPIPILGNTWRMVPIIGQFDISEFAKVTQLFLDRYGRIVRLGGLIGRPDLLFVYDADEIERMYRREGQTPFRPAMPCLVKYKSEVRKDFFGELPGVVGVISFNGSGSLVCCVSDKGTLHVWGARGTYPHLAAHAAPAARALCAFSSDTSAVVISEDGTFHKFTFAAEGNCHRSDFEYFLQVGDDDEFLQ